MAAADQDAVPQTFSPKQRASSDTLINLIEDKELLQSRLRMVGTVRRAAGVFGQPERIGGGGTNWVAEDRLWRTLHIRTNMGKFEK